MRCPAHTVKTESELKSRSKNAQKQLVVELFGIALEADLKTHTSGFNKLPKAYQESIIESAKQAVDKTMAAAMGLN